jgi:putative peptide zinc metalloprotease protein
VSPEAGRPLGPPPCRPRDLELIGEFKGSGFREPTFLVRRADGQAVRLSLLLWLITTGADGRRDLPDLAGWVSTAFGRPVSAEDIRFLVDRKLAPAGVLTGSRESEEPLERARPLLVPVARMGLVKQSLVEAVARVLAPLFRPPILFAALGSLVALDAWLFLVHGVTASLYAVARDPGAILLVLGLTALATAFHELGHASACHYGGARPGRIGVGLYLVWPVLYTDLTDTYRLDRRGRLRADLGGVYFNALFALGTAAGYLITGSEPLLVAILVQHYQAGLQLLPLLRFDGHYVLSDVTGVPDIMSRVPSALRSLVSGCEPDPRTEELRPRVRSLVLAYALGTSLLLAAGLVFFLIHVPGMVSAALGRAPAQLDRMVGSLTGGDVLGSLSGALGFVALALPAMGSALVLSLLGRRLIETLRHSGFRVRYLLCPEPGFTARTLAWNSLFVAAELLAVGALALVARDAIGAV